MTRTLALFVLLASTACYAYTPIETASRPVPGERLRIGLTPQGMVEMTRYLGPSVTEAEGALARVNADGSLVLAVDFVRMLNGTRQPWSGEGVVSFPRMYVRHIERRQFRKRQTVVAAVAATGALLGIAIMALSEGGAEGNPGGGGPSPPP